MAEEQKLYRIGEVSRLTATKAFVLRYWETEFPMLQPVKSPKGQRLYRQQDVDTVLEIKRLLYDEGFTIAGARRHLQEQNGGPARRGDTAGRASAARDDDHAGDPEGRSYKGRERKALLEAREELRAILTLLKGK